MKRAVRRWLLTGCILLSGCMSPVALNQAVMAYDEAASAVLSRQLLLNIARARQHLPMHFTAIANIAATFNFQFNAGVSPALTGNQGGLLAPLLGASMAENPTISIMPVEGEEFTRRFLTPLGSDRIILLLRQGYDVDMLLRLVASELHLETGDTEQIYHNRPKIRTEYPVFRQAVLHLSTIQDRNALHVDPLTAILTNYDPAQLTQNQRAVWNDWARAGNSDEIRLDIRAEYPGGEYPIRGYLRLRSFYSLLNFVGGDTGEEQEYPVEPDARSPDVSENPVHALAVLEDHGEDCDPEVGIRLNGHPYCLARSRTSFWNREAFRVIYQLFQMTVTHLPRDEGPNITIAK